MSKLIRGNKKIINGWAMYDWANSVYSLTITTAVFPLYYLAITSNDDHSAKMINFFGFTTNNVSLYSYALSASFLIAAAVAPLLSGIADYTGNKKAFMKFFCYLGSIACISLYFFTGESTVELGLISFVLASIGYTGSIVFYNAYLPEIAEEKDQDKVSAKGFALGYIGSVLLLIVNLVLIMFPETFGIEDSTMAPRISFVMVGLWWMGFAQITFSRLPANVFGKKPHGKVFSRGYMELKKVFNQLKHYGSLSIYLIAFFFFSMALQTVMYLAPTFAEKEIKMESEMLIVLVLIIQIVAIFGAYFFSWLSKKQGNIRALVVAVIIWIGIVAAVYFIYTPTPFMAAAFAVGFVMGGSQALSRSTYSKLLPETEDHASFFSFYDVAEKLSIVLGTLFFGLITAYTGSTRNSLFALFFFFVVGLILLLLVKRKANAHQQQFIVGEH